MRTTIATPKDANTMESFAAQRPDPFENQLVDKKCRSGCDRHRGKDGQRQREGHAERGDGSRQQWRQGREQPVEHQSGVGADGQQLCVRKVGKPQGVHRHGKPYRAQGKNGANQNAVDQILNHEALILLPPR